MQRKYRFAAIFGIIFVLALLLFTYNLSLAQPQGDDNGPELPENPQLMGDGSLFVVPESPLGTFGIVVSCALALGLFAMRTKRK